jgi:putative FmdB family regulatory protein
MPLYEFICDVCHKESEVIQKTSDPPPVCPDNAEHGPMRKKVSKTNFNLVGGGWANDGYSH